MITREDVWRELELLPMWQLRVPVVSIPIQNIQNIQNIEVMATAIAEIPVVEVLPTTSENQTTSQNIAPIAFEMTLSQDKKWAFIYKLADRMDAASQSILLSNILQALYIDKPVKSQLQNLTENPLTEISTQVIVAMGEPAAQALLNSQDSIENLRGKVHTVAGSTVVATYDLAHLLAKPLDKANTWQDLCLVRNLVDALP